MKKILFFAAAMLGLVACNNKDNALNGNQPIDNPTPAIQAGQPCTLTGMFNFSSSNNSSARMISPLVNEIENDSLWFKWQKYDALTITSQDGSDRQSFIVMDIDSKGYSTLQGTAVAGMDKGYDVKFVVTDSVVRYQPDGFNPIATGQGVGKDFMLGTYNPVLALKLTTEEMLKITAIRYYVKDGETPILNTTLYCEDKLNISSGYTTVYFPVLATASAKQSILEFWNGENAYMNKIIPVDIETSTMYFLPELTVAQVPGYTPLAPYQDEETVLKPKSEAPKKEYQDENGDWQPLEEDTELTPGAQVPIRIKKNNVPVDTIVVTPPTPTPTPKPGTIKLDTITKGTGTW